MQERRKERDECMNTPFVECHVVDLSSAGSEEIEDRVCAPVVLREPLFADHGTETGTETGRRAGEPEAVDSNGEAGGPEGSDWVEYSNAWVSAVQNLVREYG